MLHLLSAEKGIMYHVLYWLTAFLPVILGLTITYILVKVLTKKYKGDDNEDMFDEFTDENDE
jgi:uncharacterized membrane-anchored protein YhcB (DUF1043 family)